MFMKKTKESRLIFLQATARIKELEIKESINISIIQNLQQQFHEYKETCERVRENK